MKQISLNMFAFDKTERPDPPFSMIGPTQVHSWVFDLDTINPQIVGINQISERAQDLSIQCWFSKSPGGNALFTDMFSYGQFNCWRRLTEFTIWDNKIDFPATPTSYLETIYPRNHVSDLNPPPKHLQIPGGQQYYFNVRNMQNADNSYYIKFKY